MSDDVTLKPKKSVVTKSSLGLAQQVAQKLGSRFDAQKEAALADNLYETIYADILRLLALDTPELDLHAGMFSIAQIFAAQTKERKNVIVLDQVFDFWIYALCFLVSIKAACNIDEDEENQILDTIHHMMIMMRNPKQYREKRMLLLRYHTDYTRVLGNISHPLARAMTTFCICHEIAHHQLGHIGTASGTDQELAADAQAARYFATLVEKGKLSNQSFAHVDARIAGTPLLLFALFDLYEHWSKLNGYTIDTTTHPPATDRAAHINSIVQATMNAESQEFFTALTNTVKDIKAMLERAYAKD